MEDRTKEVAKKKKQDAEQYGEWAENYAAEYLCTKGYIIRERRWVPFVGKGEIDIIAQMGDEIIFVEVKAREESLDAAIQSVDSAKKRYIARGADKYLKYLDDMHPYRFDIIGIGGTQESPELEHIEDAFLPPLTSVSRWR